MSDYMRKLMKLLHPMKKKINNNNFRRNIQDLNYITDFRRALITGHRRMKILKKKQQQNSLTYLKYLNK